MFLEVIVFAYPEMEKELRKMGILCRLQDTVTHVLLPVYVYQYGALNSVFEIHSGGGAGYRHVRCW